MYDEKPHAEYVREQVMATIDEQVAEHMQWWTLGVSESSCCDECGFPPPAKGNVVYEDSGRRPLCRSCNAKPPARPWSRRRWRGLSVSRKTR